jgi:acyl-lipid omega-6 desaturase (Delta-12 desaturase)
MKHAPDTRTSAPLDGPAIQNETAKYQQAGPWRSIWQLTNSIVPYFLLFGYSLWVVRYSFWFALPAIVLAAGFLLRLFIIFHDCGHGAFFKSPRLNQIVGTITGILTFTPYHYWHKSHARHHATSANLDKRGFGDVWMMTTEEYQQASPRTRLSYRLYRNPLIMFGLGPLFLLLKSHRIPREGSTTKERLSVHLTTLAILAIAAGLIMLVGWRTYLLVQLPTIYIALVAGIWIFYVQHQFEGVYWARQREWDFVSASIEGGSFYQLPAVLNWFTGNIGYHHVHHLNSRIPNYNLPKCHDQIPELNKVPKISLWSGFKAVSYRLWDEQSNRLVSFRAARKRRQLAD